MVKEYKTLRTSLKDSLSADLIGFYFKKEKKTFLEDKKNE